MTTVLNQAVVNDNLPDVDFFMSRILTANSVQEKLRLLRFPEGVKNKNSDGLFFVSKRD